MIKSFRLRLVVWPTILTLSVAPCAAAQTRSAPDALDLRTVLDSVARNHPMIGAARELVNAARGSRASAGSLGNPMFSYQLEGTAFPGTAAPVGIDRESMAMITLPLEALYQRGARVGRANAQIRVAEAESDASRQTTLRDAARAYSAVLRAQVRVDAMRDVASWLDTLERYNRSRVDEGVTAEADLIRTEVEKGRLSAELATHEAELARARAELAVFLGDSGFVRSGKRLAIPVAALAIPNSAAPVTLRPDVRMAQARVDASQSAISVERSMIVPDFGAIIGSKRMLGTTSMIAGVSVPLPLFNQNRGEVSRAIAERNAATLSLAQSTRAAASEIIGAREAVRVLTSRVSSLGSATGNSYLARAEQSKQIALGAYREGAVPLLQVLDAARAWADARVAYFDLLFAQHESVLDLLFASGTDLRTAFQLDANTR
jgi:outer membrane protein, heavy metal efflux system